MKGTTQRTNHTKTIRGSRCVLRLGICHTIHGDDLDQSPDKDDDSRYDDAATHDRMGDVANDGARGVKAMNVRSDPDGDDGAQEEVDKSAAEADDDEFDAADTLDVSSLALESQASRVEARKKLLGPSQNLPPGMSPPRGMST